MSRIFTKHQKEIRKINIESIPDFDILTTGFPCQPFTKLGGQKGFAHKRGTIFEYIVNIAKTKNPRILFLENVWALLQTNGGKCFELIKSEITEIGYSVYHEVINGKSILPQNRNRVYIVCIRKDIDDGTFEFPTLCNLERCVEDILMNDFFEDYEYLVPTE
eukprot:UN24886